MRSFQADGAPNRVAVELGALVKQVQVVLPRVADGAVQGERRIGQIGRVGGHLGLRHRGDRRGVVGSGPRYDGGGEET